MLNSYKRKILNCDVVMFTSKIEKRPNESVKPFYKVTNNVNIQKTHLKHYNFILQLLTTYTHIRIFFIYANIFYHTFHFDFCLEAILKPLYNKFSELINTLYLVQKFREFM